MYRLDVASGAEVPEDAGDMRKNRGARGLGLLAATVASSLACRQIVDFPDPPAPTPEACGSPYGTSPRPDGKCAAADSIPDLPAIPDSAREEDCRVCARERCLPERQECLDSAQCLALLRCQGECRDPNCIFSCRDRLRPSQIFEDYLECVFGGSLLATGLRDDRDSHGQCKGPCATGENWECVGRFKWDAIPQQGSLLVEVQIVDGSIVTVLGPAEPLAGLPGIEIGPCGPGLGETQGDGGCPEFLPANGYGALTIEFVPRIHAAIGVKSPYGHYRAYARPLMRDSRVRLFLPQRNFNLASWSRPRRNAGDPLDLLGRGIVAFRQWDCLAMLGIASHAIVAAGSRFYWSLHRSRTSP